MKHKKIILISIILLALVTISAVSAEDNAMPDDFPLENMDSDISGEISVEDSQEATSLESSSDDNGQNEDILKCDSLKEDNSDLLSENPARENFTIEFYDDYHIYGETNFFGFLMPKDIENNVSVEIDAKSYDFYKCDVGDSYQWIWGGDKDSQTGYMVMFSDLTPGGHQLIISYPGDDKYCKNSLVKTITVYDEQVWHPFSVIQNEIDNAEENATIILNGTYIGFGKEILINKSITLEGTGNDTVLDANSTCRILNITSGVATLRNLNLINAKSIVNCGGAVFASGELIVDNCTFKNNVVDIVDNGLTADVIYYKQLSGEMDMVARGGAIYCEGNLSVRNSMFYANDARSFGAWRDMDSYEFLDNAGATTIYVMGNMILDNTTVTKYGFGGTCDVEAIRNLEIYGCQFNGARTDCGRSSVVNNSIFNGGSTFKSFGRKEYYGDNTSCTILNSIFKNSDESNTSIDSDVYNALIFLSGDYVEVSGNNFSNNSICNSDIMHISRTYCTLNLFNNTFKDNLVVGRTYYAHCSAISLKGCNASIIQCSFINNSGPIAGVIFSSNSNIIVEDSNFTNNSPAAIELQKSTIKVNGNDYGYYFKGLLNDSVDGVEDIDDLIKFTIEFYDDYYIYNETSFFGFVMPIDVVMSASVTIDGKKYDYDISFIDNPDAWMWGGDAETQRGHKVMFSDLSVGSHVVEIIYPSDYKYSESRLVRNITVHDGPDVSPAKNFTIVFYGDYYIYGETNIFGFLMPKDIENNVSVVIDGKTYGFEMYDVGDPYLWVWGGDKDSQTGYMVKFSDLTPGDHQVKIIYPSDYKYSESRLVRNITVHDGSDVSPAKNFTIVFYGDYYIYGETNIFGFLMPKDIENNVSVVIDGKTYGFEMYDVGDPYLWVWGGDKDSQTGYMVKFSDLTPGDHQVKIFYPGDYKYSKNSLVKIITVDGVNTDKVTSKLTASYVTAYYNAGKYLVASLKDENGNPIKNAQVKIQINGKTKNLTTNSLGQVKYSTNGLIPKAYDATFTYAGNGSFTASTAKAKVTIKKAIPKISAAKKTFKKSLKTKKYTITLKVNNKVMKSTKVYLKIKGKTFTAKTNKYGKATFKITKITKKGTYKATVTYKGNKYYAKTVASTKLTLK